MNSTPLQLMIKYAIQYYIKQGYMYNGQNIKEIFNQFDPIQINRVINDLITDIDNLLRFKIKNYFENYYKLLTDKLGVDQAGPDWAEFLEYGTVDYRVIEMQNIGIPRHIALYILDKHIDCLLFENFNLIGFDYEKLFNDIDKKSEENRELMEIFAYEINK